MSTSKLNAPIRSIDAVRVQCGGVDVIPNTSGVATANSGIGFVTNSANLVTYAIRADPTTERLNFVASSSTGGVSATDSNIISFIPSGAGPYSNYAVSIDLVGQANPIGAVPAATSRAGYFTLGGAGSAVVSCPTIAATSSVLVALCASTAGGASPAGAFSNASIVITPGTGFTITHPAGAGAAGLQYSYIVVG